MNIQTSLGLVRSMVKKLRKNAKAPDVLEAVETDHKRMVAAAHELRKRYRHSNDAAEKERLWESEREMWQNIGYLSDLLPHLRRHLK